MRIAINGLAARFGGGAAYLSNLLEHLAEIDRENEYIVFSSPEKRDSFTVDAANFSMIVPRFPGRAIVRRSIWEQLILPALLKKHHVDILFSPGGIAPVIVPDGCKYVNLTQNMAPFSHELLASYPLNRRKLRFLMLRKLYPFFAAKADANIFISIDGLNNLHRVARFDREKSKVIYHGRNRIFQPLSLNTASDFARTQYDINGEFILYVSNIARYKKQLEVIKAYSMIRKRRPCRLILAGILVEPDYYSEVMELANRLGISDEVTYLGQVPQTHLPYLYSAASVFVFASIAENCPNILIEAMACGAPIASSNLGPMPEICGDAALYFNPSNPADIANKVWQILTDETVKRKLTGNALENAKRFSWQETARKMLEIFSNI